MNPLNWHDESPHPSPLPIRWGEGDSFAGSAVQRNARRQWKVDCRNKFIGMLAMALLVAFSFLNVQAVPNKVLELDGNGSYVTLPPNIFSNLSQATVEVWAKWEGFYTYSRIYEFGAGYHSMALFNHERSPDVRFNLYPQYAKGDRTLMHTIRATNVLKSNDWVHLATVAGPGGMKLYVNGVLAGEHTNAACLADIKTYQTNVLGRGLAREPDNRDFAGQIDEVRVWRTRRTEAQIRANMHQRLTGSESGLAALWNFDDGTARDLVRNHRGKMVGNARVVTADAESDAMLISDEPKVVPQAPAPVVSTPTPPVTVAASTPSAREGRDPVVWWIAGALVMIAALLGCLLLMLRRSGVGKDKLLPAVPARAGLPDNSGSAGSQELKDQALQQLTEFAKESLVQGLYSQRKALLEAQQKAQQEIAQLESRLAAAELPERVRAYEKRIAELEGELDSKSEEVKELTKATLVLLRQKLEEEKQMEQKARRFN